MTTWEPTPHGCLLRCCHCGNCYELTGLNHPLWVLGAVARGFRREHRACRPCRAHELPSPEAFVAAKLSAGRN